MDWTNENIIEFLQLLQTEPSIWNNNRGKTHRNRILVSEAWNRIQSNFSLRCTVEELKRKRNSLLTQYRDIIRKIKESQQKACDGVEIYKPSWFAFDVMNSYLSHLYESPIEAKIEELVLSYVEDPLSNDSDTYNETDTCEIVSELKSNKRSISWESNPRILHTRRLSHNSTTPSEQDSYISKKRRATQELRVTQEREAPNVNARYREERDRVRECDLYGQLLAEKLKPLEQDERLQFMNEIDNLVFNHLMKIRRHTSQSKPIHLPGPSNKMP